MWTISTIQSYHSENYDSKINYVNNIYYNIRNEIIKPHYKFEFSFEIISTGDLEKPTLFVFNKTVPKPFEWRKYILDVVINDELVQSFGPNDNEFRILPVKKEQNREIHLIFKDQKTNKMLQRTSIYENNITKDSVNNFVIDSNVSQVKIPFSTIVNFHADGSFNKYVRYWNLYLYINPLTNEKSLKTALSISLFADNTYNSKVHRYIPDANKFNISKYSYSAAFNDDKREEKFELSYFKENKAKTTKFNFEFIESKSDVDSNLIQLQDNSVKVNKKFNGILTSKFLINTNFGTFIINRNQNFTKAEKPSKADSLVIQELEIKDLETLKKRNFKYQIILEKVADLNLFKLSQWIKLKRKSDEENS
ncbi:hypothetical protein BCF59_0449 [Mycoplasmopsis mustelae]|uniref:Uncharacterized protein n=1 Tax=Mycoplasmopsis mustelae TaxID=171289 RepID=A0A4R7UDD3_9BACT|nr:hypothetical protein [Mycoplasmopsis mustelae]TDV24477.1 hypothetical protein BCF59_0449 [Mycoplasmopsis mustelae]